jgi:hypothetical protein
MIPVYCHGCRGKIQLSLQKNCALRYVAHVHYHRGVGLLLPENLEVYHGIDNLQDAGQQTLAEAAIETLSRRPAKTLGILDQARPSDEMQKHRRTRPRPQALLQLAAIAVTNEVVFANIQASRASTLLDLCRVLTTNHAHKYHLFMMHAEGGCDDDSSFSCKSLGIKLAALGSP